MWAKTEHRRRAAGLWWPWKLLIVTPFLLPMVLTLQLKHLGEQAVGAERDLQAVLAELRTQDALEWRAVSARVPPAELAPELAQSRLQAQRLAERALPSGHEERAERVRTALARYHSAVDQELVLLATGDEEAAADFDESAVDPAFDAAIDVLQQEGATLSAAARRAQVLSDGGVVLTVLLSLAVTAWLQSRRRRDDVRREAERRSETRYQALIDRSTDLVIVTDRAGRVQFLSPSADRALLLDQDAGTPSATRPDAGPRTLSAALAGDDLARLDAALQAATPGAVSSLELHLQGRAGPRLYDVSILDLTGDPDVGGLVLTAHDITERRTLQGQLEHRALHDALTGLPNRALLADRLGQELRACQRDGSSAGLLLIDLDRFREINDTFGHHYGDALLVQVGPRLRAVLREVDTVARLGGDEFAVLLPEVHDLDAVRRVADKLLQALHQPFVVEQVDLDVEASIGAVLSGEHGTDPNTLLQRADIAMYVAKNGGLSVAAYDPAADGHSPDKVALLGDLRRGLDRGELFLHYQPQVSITTGDVVGAEALVRWQHPDRGLLFPDAFIPLAEHTGLIGPLTRHVVSRALAQARRWADAGRPLAVSVNLSARNLLDSRLPDQIAGLLAEHGVPAGLLELEVTESAIMTEPARAKHLLEELAALGIRLSIDDFGAGYTSLGQLKSLPVTVLKIDKSFVLTMTTDARNALIVRSVVDLGHNLGLTLVAEGVETAEALTTLRDYGCDLAQGYHLSRPVAAEDLDRWRAGRGFGSPTTEDQGGFRQVVDRHHPR